MTIFSNKLIVGVVAMVTMLAIGVSIAATINDSIIDDSAVQEESVVGKTRYFKAKDCPEEAYENKDNNTSFYTMCRAYTTDGVFVYYDGMREIVLPPMSMPTIINGRVASSSLPTYTQPKPWPIVIEGADSETFEIISSHYLDSSLDPEQNPTLTYARDKNFLYRMGEKVVDADPDTLVILGRGYIKDKNSVYDRGRKIEGSDPKTFEFLKYGYARDKNFVYLVWQDKKIENSDGKSFEIIDEDYAKDSGAVYYKQKKLEGVDPGTFELVYQTYVGDGTYTSPSGYAKDKNFLYYQGERIEGADPDTFEIVGFHGIHARDKNFVYGYRAKKLSWIDANTFKIVSDVYFKDKNSVYYGEGKIIDNIDPITFEYLGGIYFKDRNSVWRSYYADEGGAIGSVSRIKDADPGTFQFLEYGYARDKNFVYYNGDILLDAISESFEVLNQEYSKDKNFVYFVKDKIKDADSDTFEVVDYTYTKDKNSVYYRGVKLNGVDAISLSVLSCGYAKDKSKVFTVNYNGAMNILDAADPDSFRVFEGNCYAKDKNFVYYYNGMRIEGADHKTFEIIDAWHTKDLSSVYYMGTRIEGADVKTFEAVKGDYAKDKNSVYYKGIRIEGADQGSFEVNNYGTAAKDKNTNYTSGKPVGAEEMVNHDIIFPPGMENAVLERLYPLDI